MLRFTTNVSVTTPPGKIVYDGVAGLLPEPATPNTAVWVLPEALVVVGLGPVVPTPAKVTVVNEPTDCNPNGVGKTSVTATPNAAPAVLALLTTIL